MKSIFEKTSGPAVKFPETGFEKKQRPSEKYLRKEPAALPQPGERETVRHFTKLAGKNFSVDGNFYPLGSCTMKYNPKFLEKVVSLEGFSSLHPFSFMIKEMEPFCRGSLEVMFMLQELLCEITGMDAATLQPMAGAQGELTGLLTAMAYHSSNGQRRDKVIVPDTSHGTNPASAAQAGCRVLTVSTAEDGRMDIAEFGEKLGSDTALVIITLPNTLGLFNSNIVKLAEMAHSKGALMYCDGANMNAVMGKVKPGRAGFDIIHTNLHKTFAAPHGGGGPGSGPVCVKKELEKFLPGPRIVREGDTFSLKQRPQSIGRVAPFFGNFAVFLKALAYIMYMGGDGLQKASEIAVLNANYVREKLKDDYDIPYGRRCMHEFVLSTESFVKDGVRAMDIAKYLIDRGIHPPTVYFPLLVKEAMMIEPTETENRQMLETFIGAMRDAAKIARENPRRLKNAPEKSETGRLDETYAARNLKIVWDRK